MALSATTPRSSPTGTVRSCLLGKSKSRPASEWKLTPKSSRRRRPARKRGNRRTSSPCSDVDRGESHVHQTHQLSKAHRGIVPVVFERVEKQQADHHHRQRPDGAGETG